MGESPAALSFLGGEGVGRWGHGPVPRAAAGLRVLTAPCVLRAGRERHCYLISHKGKMKFRGGKRICPVMQLVAGRAETQNRAWL